MKCTVGGAPKSAKWAQVATEEDTGPFQWGEEEPLFLELESEEGAKARTEKAGLEIPGNAATELMEPCRLRGQQCKARRISMNSCALRWSDHRSLSTSTRTRSRSCSRLCKSWHRASGTGCGQGWTHGLGWLQDGRSGLREKRMRGKGHGVGGTTPYLR